MLDEKSAVPLYEQLNTILNDRILSGKWAFGQKIPSEAELVQEFRVSRGTVRQALSRLTQQGLVYRKPGKGSFVVRPKIQQSLNEFYDLSSSFQSKGLDLDVHVIRAETQSPPVQVRTMLQMEGDGAVHWIERLLCAREEVLVYEHIFLRAEVAPGLLEEDLVAENLYEVLAERYGVHVERARETFEIVEMCRHEQKLMGPLPLPVLQRSRVTYARGGAFEYRRSTIRGDICAYHVELKVG
jgi:GntR family transcriptional regulator